MKSPVSFFMIWKHLSIKDVNDITTIGTEGKGQKNMVCTNIQILTSYAIWLNIYLQNEFFNDTLKKAEKTIFQGWRYFEIITFVLDFISNSNQAPIYLSSSIYHQHHHHSLYCHHHHHCHLYYYYHHHCGAVFIIITVFIIVIVFIITHHLHYYHHLHYNHHHHPHHYHHSCRHHHYHHHHHH